MGLTLKFFAGDANTLADVFRGGDHSEFDNLDVVLAEADMSLHIEPRDLNLLSLEAGALAGLPPIELRPYLTVAVDERERGLLRVSENWVVYLAAVPSASGATLSERWAARMREFYRQPEIIATESMTSAVNDLLALCQRASFENLSVMHAWWL